MAHYLAQPTQPAQPANPAPGATSRTVSPDPHPHFFGIFPVLLDFLLQVLLQRPADQGVEVQVEVLQKCHIARKAHRLLQGVGLVAAMGISAVAVTACGGAGEGASQPTEIRTTWFGISNFHYQIGSTGIILDGEVVNTGSAPSPSAVTKVLGALRKRGSVDYFLVGHEHGDHALQIPEYAKQTGKPIYAPEAVCQKVVAYGNPAAQCTTLKGGEVISLNGNTTVRVVRWLHSIDCGEVGAGTAGVETFGFLITTKTPDKVLSVYASDSGAGGQELFYPRIVNKGLPNQVVYGSPFDNLSAAVKDAGISKSAASDGLSEVCERGCLQPRELFRCMVSVQGRLQVTGQRRREGRVWTACHRSRPWQARSEPAGWPIGVHRCVRILALCERGCRGRDAAAGASA
ncbi:MAG: hypothetical protein JHC88_22130 [Niveispirillum sp.]|nr:hypothetical protein [Niveispirillum sp.]